MEKTNRRPSQETLLFSTNCGNYALRKSIIDSVIPLEPLIKTEGLPRVFEGFLYFNEKIIPCLRLEEIFTNETNYRGRQILIFKEYANSKRYCLSFLIDKIIGTVKISHRDSIYKKNENIIHPCITNHIRIENAIYKQINTDMLLLEIEKLSN